MNTSTGEPSMSTKTLANAIALAALVHENQAPDKSGNAYILHPLTIMMRLAQKTKDQLTLMLAVLHDAVEDDKQGIINLDTMVANGWPQELVDDLRLMSKSKGEDYEMSYIPRLASSYRCILVKMEDLTHNSEIGRLKGTSEDDFKRMAKYHRSYKYLETKKAEWETVVFSNSIKV